MGSPDAAVTDSDPAVAATVRLLHRRRGWIWATVISVVAWVLVCGIAYVAGAENTSAFLPTSYSQDCGRSGCTTVTQGVLADGASATWPNQVPLGQSFTVAQPMMNWGFGSSLIDGDGTAAGTIFAGVLFDGFSVLVLVHLFKLGRRWLRHRQLGQQMAGADWAASRR